MMYFLSVIGGVITGVITAWLVIKARVMKEFNSRLDDANQRARLAETTAANMSGTIEEIRRQLSAAEENAKTLITKYETEQGARIKAETQLSESSLRLEAEMKTIDEARTGLIDAFKAIAGDTLNNSTTAFLQLANEAFGKVMIEARGDLGARQAAINGLVNPLSESLRQFQEHIRAIEKSRLEGYASLSEQLKSASETQQQLKAETANLVTALRRPEVRGRWGELTLRRVVELAGMSQHCDFCEQVSVDTEEGRRRPDMIVNLPLDRQVVVDSKAPLDAYLDATNATTEDQRRSAMCRHAAQVRGHMDNLASKSYWDQFSKAPEFVIMFIAGESFFGAAVEVDSGLMEAALQKRVVIATPATLIALLRAVAYGWRQEQIAENAQAISELGKQLFERMSNLSDYLTSIGKGLEKATEAYNKSVASLETRVLSSARRFKDLGIASEKEIPIVDTIQISPRQIFAEAEPPVEP